MIIGLGSDIVNIDRIARQLEKAGKKFKNKNFTKHEIDAANRYGIDNAKAIIAHFAKRFAAKEAFAKAAGTGIGKHLSFKDIGIENDQAGKPVIILSDKANKFVQELAGQGQKTICHVSMSDDYPYALAVVIIEAI